MTLETFTGGLIVFVKLLLRQVTFKGGILRRLRAAGLPGGSMIPAVLGHRQCSPHTRVGSSTGTWPGHSTRMWCPEARAVVWLGPLLSSLILGGKHAAAARDGGEGNRSSGLEGRALSSHLLVWNLKRRQVAGAHSWAYREPPNEGVCCTRHFAPRCRVEVLALPKWDPPIAGGFAEPFQVTEQGCLGLTPPLCWP